VVLEADGQEISRDDHEGFTGWKKEHNQYTVEVNALEAGARYVLKARVAGSGGRDSFGEIYWSRGP
jgi:hypothetical protein